MKRFIENGMVKYLLAAAILVAACEKDEKQDPADNNQPDINAGEDIISTTGLTSDIFIQANDPDGDALEISWNVIASPVGSSPEITGTSNEHVTFTTEEAGLYTLEFVANDGKGGTASDILDLYISGALPGRITENTIYTDLFEEERFPDYYVDENVIISAGVTLEPGVVIEVAADAEIHIADHAAYLNAEGTSSKQITLRGMDKVAGSWKGINIASNNVNNVLDFVNILHAGSSEIYDKKTAVFLKSNRNARLKITNTLISESGGYALQADGGSANITEFANNAFINNTQAPIRFGAENLYVLEDGSEFRGNTIQAVEIIDGSFENSGTVAFTDLPIHFIEESHIEDVVYFEAGVQCYFDAGNRLWVTDDGSIVAQGSSTQPVVFSGLYETPGSWKGIEIASASNLNSLNYCEVSFGGGTDGRGANIYLYGSGDGSRLNLTNSIIRDSQTAGVYMASGSAILTESDNTYSNNPDGDIVDN